MMKVMVAGGAAAAGSPKVPEKDAREVGERLEKFLRVMGGMEAPPSHLTVTEHEAKGIDFCDDCGKPTNLGYFDLQDNRTGRKIGMSYMVVHAMAEHGKTAYQFGDRQLPVHDFLYVKSLLKS